MEQQGKGKEKEHFPNLFYVSLQIAPNDAVYTLQLKGELMVILKAWDTNFLVKYNPESLAIHINSIEYNAKRRFLFLARFAT